MINLYAYKKFIISNIRWYFLCCFGFSVCAVHRDTVIFLIVSKEIQKYDQRKFYFFSEKKHFQIWYSIIWYIISQTSNTKEIREKILKKIFAEIFL